MKILDIGSLNIDKVYSVEHFVSAGETLTAGRLETFSGGKGLNQAIAAARAGAEVYCAGAIGEDGLFLKELLENSGVHTDCLQVLEDVPTGHAVIQLIPKGQNCIIISAGANGALTEDYIDSVLERFAAGDVLLDEDICSVLPALANSYELEKERARKMENLTKAEENMQLKDVRIIHIPAAAVASARYFGPDPESHAGRMIADFTRENKLWEKVPDLRMFGFNSPNPPPEGGEYGYEFWVTIPEDMDVPAPLEKKRLPGGTYAAHAIKMGDFHEWQWLFKWAYESGEYEKAGSGTPEDMYGCLEEHLNFYEHIQETPEGEPEIPQLDLLIPVRKKG